jgi:hypothetical protein
VPAEQQFQISPEMIDALGGNACSALGFGESAAMRKYRVKSGWTARSLALHTQAVLQGGWCSDRKFQSSRIFRLHLSAQI